MVSNATAPSPSEAIASFARVSARTLTTSILSRPRKIGNCKSCNGFRVIAFRHRLIVPPLSQPTGARFVRAPFFEKMMEDVRRESNFLRWRHRPSTTCRPWWPGQGSANTRWPLGHSCRYRYRRHQETGSLSPDSSLQGGCWRRKQWARRRHPGSASFHRITVRRSAVTRSTQRQSGCGRVLPRSQGLSQRRL